MSYYPLKVKDTSGNVHTVGDPRTTGKVSKTGDTMTGGLTVSGGDVTLTPPSTVVGTVTGVTSTSGGVSLPALVASGSGVDRIRFKLFGFNGTPSVNFRNADSGLPSSDAALLSAIQVGQTLRFTFPNGYDNVPAGGYVEFVVTSKPTSIDTSAYMENTFDVAAWPAQLYQTDRSLFSDTVVVSQRMTTVFSVATNSASISIPVSAFLIGSTTYQTSQVTINGGTINVPTDPGSVTGQAVKYYGTTSAGLVGTASDGSTTALRYNAVKSRWEISEYPISNATAIHSTFFGQTQMTAQTPRIIVTTSGTIYLPSTASLSVGETFEVINLTSGGYIPVRKFGDTSSNILTLAPKESAVLIATSTSQEDWAFRRASTASLPDAGSLSMEYVLSASGGEPAWVSSSQVVKGLTSSQVPYVDLLNKTASYTLGQFDAGSTLTMSSSAAQTVTIPTDASVSFPTGTKIDIIQTGTGECSVSPAAGVTLNSEGGKRKINAQWQAATLIKRGANTWVLFGALKV